MMSILRIITQMRRARKVVIVSFDFFLLHPTSFSELRRTRQAVELPLHPHLNIIQ